MNRDIKYETIGTDFGTHETTGSAHSNGIHYEETLTLDTNKLSSGRLTEYEVIGRHLPTEANPTPAMYRMTIFAPNETVAKSRYWYFLRGLKKVKKATGEIVSIKAVCRLPQATEKKNQRQAADEEGKNYRSTRSTPRRSRTSVSGCDTTLDLARTTCTRSTVS